MYVSKTICTYDNISKVTMNWLIFELNNYYFLCTCTYLDKMPKHWTFLFKTLQPWPHYRSSYVEKKVTVKYSAVVRDKIVQRCLASICMAVGRSENPGVAVLFCGHNLPSPLSGSDRVNWSAKISAPLGTTGLFMG